MKGDFYSGLIFIIVKLYFFKCMNDLNSCEHVWTRVCAPDAWKACCVVNSISLKH